MVDAILKVVEVVKAAPTELLYNKELCAVVALDVVNECNTAKWPRIDILLHAKGVPAYLVYIIRSYFGKHELQYSESDRRVLTCGVSQRLVIGSLLWNLMYDNFLRVDTGGNVHGLSLSARSLLEILQIFRFRGKADVALLTTKQDYASSEFEIRGQSIAINDQILYFERPLCFFIQSIPRKAASAGVQSTA